MNKLNLFIKRYWQYGVLGLLAGFIVFSIIVDKAKSNIDDIVSSITKEKVIKEEVAKVEPQCTTKEVELVIGESAILKQMNLFVMDLGNTKYISDSFTRDYWTKKDMYGVKRELIVGARQVYIMIYEPIDDLKYNIKEYKSYLERTKDQNLTQNK